jgi:hypothetical protein
MVFMQKASRQGEHSAKTSVLEEEWNLPLFNDV